MNQPFKKYSWIDSVTSRVFGVFMYDNPLSSCWDKWFSAFPLLRWGIVVTPEDDNLQIRTNNCCFLHPWMRDCTWAMTRMLTGSSKPIFSMMAPKCSHATYAAISPFLRNEMSSCPHGFIEVIKREWYREMRRKVWFIEVIKENGTERCAPCRGKCDFNEIRE